MSGFPKLLELKADEVLAKDKSPAPSKPETWTERCSYYANGSKVEFEVTHHADHRTSACPGYGKVMPAASDVDKNSEKLTATPAPKKLDAADPNVPDVPDFNSASRDVRDAARKNCESEVIQQDGESMLDYSKRFNRCLDETAIRMSRIEGKLKAAKLAEERKAGSERGAPGFTYNPKKDRSAYSGQCKAWTQERRGNPSHRCTRRATHGAYCWQHAK